MKLNNNMKLNYMGINSSHKDNNKIDSFVFKM